MMGGSDPDGNPVMDVDCLPSPNPLEPPPMTPEQVRVIFERVAYRMVAAGWLEGYGFTAGAGHELVWRPDGAQNALLLRDLSDRFDLAEDDDTPLYFHMACKGMGLPPGIGFPPIEIEVSAFWLLCVGALGLEGDADGLLAMVHIVTGWGPDAGSSTPGGRRVGFHGTLEWTSDPTG